MLYACNPDDGGEDTVEDELKEVRMLAASMVGEFMRHGVTVESAVESALNAAEKLIERSIARANAAREVEANASALARITNGPRARQ